MSDRIPKKVHLLFLALMVPAPVIGELAAVYIPGLRGTPLGQGIWFAAKIWLVSMPLVWLKRVEGTRITWPGFDKTGWWQGLVLGFLFAAVLGAVYLLPDPPLLDAAVIRGKAAMNGLDQLPKFLILALSLSFINALAEEYVWRWFIFKRFLPLTGGRVRTAALLSALFFTLHHTLLLAAQMTPLATFLGSLGVFGAGLVWSWCYVRYKSVWPGYICHILADLAIFVAAWDLIFNV